MLILYRPIFWYNTLYKRVFNAILAESGIFVSLIVCFKTYGTFLRAHGVPRTGAGHVWPSLLPGTPLRKLLSILSSYQSNLPDALYSVQASHQTKQIRNLFQRWRFFVKSEFRCILRYLRLSFLLSVRYESFQSKVCQTVDISNFLFQASSDFAFSPPYLHSKLK